MSDVNSERIRHEAVESVGARPPKDSDDRVQGAMRRYLGSAAFELQRPRRRRAAAPEHPAGDEEKTDGS